jgi:secondary thiamine-phosphate synthase enzyme
MVQKIALKSKHRSEVIEITNEVQEAVIKSGIKDGVVVVYTPHTTAGVMLFENQDPNLHRDILGKMGEIAPLNAKYAHVGTNADAHIKSAITGASLMVIVENAQIITGKWQGIFFVDYDGPREREVLLKFLKQ